MKLYKTGMLLQRTVVIIAALILIGWQALFAVTIDNTAFVSFAAGRNSVLSKKSNTVSFVVQPAQIRSIYPTSNVMALTSDDSIVIAFDAKMHQTLKDTTSSFGNDIDFYYDTENGTVPVQWTDKWTSGAAVLEDTVNIGFTFVSQKRYTLLLNSLKDGTANNIKDTYIVFYTALDNTQSCSTFRRDKYGGVTEVDLPAYAIDSEKSVIRISMPSEMLPQNDKEQGTTISDTEKSYIKEANDRAVKEGTFLISSADYKPYRKFNLFTYSDTDARWYDYFDSDADNVTDTNRVFQRKATIKMPYNKAKLPAGTVEDNLRIYRLSFAPKTKSWYWKRLVDSRKAADGDYLTAKIEHFSIYTILNTVPPAVTRLYQNYPNPFNPSVDGATKIDFDLNAKARVTAEIYTILGELVTTLVQERYYDAADQYYYTNYGTLPQTIMWDGTNDYGKKVASGLYILRFVVKFNNGSTYQKYMKIVVER